MLASRAPVARRRLARPRPSHAGPGPHRGGQEGIVTAEFAVVLPAVVFVLALSLGALALALDQVRCVDAARAGARAASRGDSDGAVVSLAVSADLVRVSVVSRSRLAGSLLPGWLRANSTASVARELTDSRQ